MRVGLHAPGIETGARPEVIRAVAIAAEGAGFATSRTGERMVLVNQSAPTEGERCGEPAWAGVEIRCRWRLQGLATSASPATSAEQA